MDRDTAGATGASTAGRLARFPCGRVTKWIVVVFWLFAAVAMGPLAGKLGDAQENEAVNWLPSNAESTQVYQVSERYQNPNEAPAVVVYERREGLTDADRALARSDVATFNGIEGVEAPVEGPFESPDRKALQLVVPFDMGEKGNGWEKLPEFVDEIKAADVPNDGLLLYVTGPAGFNGDFADAFAGTEGALLIAALAVVVLILLLTYRSPWLWLLPTISAVVALAVAMGIVYLFAEHGGLTVTAQAQVILSILVFGAGTDYALLLVARYKEELRRHEDRHEAMAFALHRAGPAVFASGATVLLGMLCLLFADMNSTASLGPVLAIGIAVGLLVMMTFLPAVLVIGGRWLFWPTHPTYGSPDPAVTGIWGKIARGIAPRPRIVWIGTTLVLGSMAIGITQLSANGLTYKESFVNIPDSIVGQTALSAHFPSGAGDPVIVMAKAGSAQAVADKLAQVPGVVPGSVAVSPPQGDLAYMEATLTDRPDGSAAKDTVQRVRDAVHQVDGADAITGGSTAVQLDTQNASARDNKVVIPITLAVVFLILIALLRALVAPLLLLATVVVSFAAALGISAVVFTHVLNYAGADASLPLFSFVFLVALGIDYNIFLMTRVQEEAKRVGTREGAIIGLTATGAVITSAGLVLAGTFSVMTAVPMIFLVEIGFLVAVGVLLDTFIVRSILVTALTLDLDRHIWWPGMLSKAHVIPRQATASPVMAVPMPMPVSVPMSGPIPGPMSGPMSRPMSGPIPGPMPGPAPIPMPMPVPAPAPWTPAPANARAGAATGGAVATAGGPSVVTPPPAPTPAPNGSGTMARVNPKENLLAGPPETRLPELQEARDLMDAGQDAAAVAARFPDYSRAWATLADGAYGRGSVVESYAYARTGYHRGLDALRRSGWKGHGPVPWEHEPNQGFLRSLHALGRAAAAIGEEDEAHRCYSFLIESSAAAADALAAPRT